MVRSTSVRDLLNASWSGLTAPGVVFENRCGEPPKPNHRRLKMNACEISAEGAVWEVAAEFGKGVSEVGAAEGTRDRGGALDARSCAYADNDKPVRRRLRKGVVAARRRARCYRLTGEF